MLSAAAAAALLTSLGTASPAAAVDDGLLLSPDGSTWYTSLSGSVFAADGTLVPGDTLHGRFYIMNNRDEAAYVRVGLSALTVTTFELAQQLTLTTVGTTASSASGSTVPLAAPDAVCSDFIGGGTRLAPHGIMLVSADLRFKATTPGVTAQGELAEIAFITQLSDIDLDATATPLCTGSLTIGTPAIGPDGGRLGGDPGSAVTPGGGTGSGGGPGTAGAAGTASDAGGGGTGSTADGASGGGGTLTGSASDLIAVGPETGDDLPEWANSARRWEEYAILIPLGAAIAGLGARMAAARRWQRADTEGKP